MSISSKTFEKSSIFKGDSTANGDSSRSPFEGVDHQSETPAKTPAVDLSRGALWKPLYVVSLVAMVAALVVLGVSLAVDMFYVDVKLERYIGRTAFAAVCDGGCAAAGELSVDTLFEPHYMYVRRPVTSEVLSQMQPFAVTSCTERSTGVFDISAGSHTAKARGDFHVNCSAPVVKGKYTDFKYAEGFTFYHAVGAPRIPRMDYLVQQQTVPVVGILFVFSGVALVLYVAVFALRATLSGADFSYERERCCACRAPNHVRRLTAAVIAFLVLSVVMTITQLAICALRWVPSDRCEDCGEYITVTGVYWALFAVILVLQLVALGLVCACYAMRV